MNTASKKTQFVVLLFLSHLGVLPVDTPGSRGVSVGSLSRSSTVLVSHTPDTEPCRRYGGHRAIEPETESEQEETRRFWELTKRFFEEVDAFPLVVESPTPFKFRNRSPDIENTVAEIEDQRRRLKPLPTSYSISDALNGVLHQRQTEADFRTLVRDPQSIERSTQKRTETNVHPKTLTPPPQQRSQDPDFMSPEACDQSISTPTCIPSMEEVLRRYFDLGQVMKIGEGTFGEAFKSGDLVVKIVPFGGSKFVCEYPQKQAQELIPEIMTSKILSHLRSNQDSPNFAEINSCQTQKTED